MVNYKITEDNELDGTPVYYAVYDKEVEKYVEWFTESTGKLYYRKNPTKANYFVQNRFASLWLSGFCLPPERFNIVTFQFINEENS